MHTVSYMSSWRRISGTCLLCIGINTNRHQPSRTIWCVSRTCWPSSIDSELVMLVHPDALFNRRAHSFIDVPSLAIKPLLGACKRAYECDVPWRSFAVTEEISVSISRTDDQLWPIPPTLCVCNTPRVNYNARGHDMSLEQFFVGAPRPASSQVPSLQSVQRMTDRRKLSHHRSPARHLQQSSM